MSRLELNLSLKGFTLCTANGHVLSISEDGTIHLTIPAKVDSITVPFTAYQVCPCGITRSVCEYHR